VIEIKHIVCPVDFSDISRRALSHAAVIGRWYGATITVLHVIPPVSATVPATPATSYPATVFTAADLGQIERELAAFAAPTGPIASFRMLALLGSVTSEIVRIARELPADLIVMGTHGRSGFQRLMLGSATEEMLRKTPCPLLTVPPHALDPPHATSEPFSRILCAVDFSPSSLRALTFAESLAEEGDGRLDVLHVLEPQSVFEPVPMGGPRNPLIDAGARAARDRLAHAVSKDARVYSRVSEIVAAGKADAEIVREAAERHSELIVIGGHGGKAGLSAFGSTANRVVRQASCAVLTVSA
jgi:nucleotide-binding universal stress UspA family protein